MYRISVWPLHALVFNDLRALGNRGFLNSTVSLLQNPKCSLVLQFTGQPCIDWKACIDQILDERNEVAPIWCKIWKDGEVVALEMRQLAVPEFSGPVITEPGTQRGKDSGHIQLVQWYAGSLNEGANIEYNIENRFEIVSGFVDESWICLKKSLDGHIGWCTLLISHDQWTFQAIEQNEPFEASVSASS